MTEVVMIESGLTRWAGIRLADAGSGWYPCLAGEVVDGCAVGAVGGPQVLSGSHEGRLTRPRRIS